jgi:predicted transcriptional regulator of viral defense system
MVIASKSRSLGSTGSYLLSTAAEQGEKILTVSEAQRLLGSTSNATAFLLHDLANKGWLRRLERGKYLILPLEAGMSGRYTEHEFIIASGLVSPYYIGYWTALNHYGYTEQLSATVFVATPKRKLPVRIGGVTYRFVNLSQAKFFGWREGSMEGHPFLISDREKTVLDCLDRPDLCGGIVEAAKGLWYGFRQKELDTGRISSYIERMDNGTLLKRIGYLCEVLQPADLGQTIEDWRQRLPEGMSLLDPSLPASGRYNRRWRLRLNVPERELTAWQES